MTMWLMRAGRQGEREAFALQNSLAVIGWEELPDLTPCKTKPELDQLLRTAYPDGKPRTLSNWHTQIWSVREAIQPGDVIVLPLKTRSAVALGVVEGPYAHRTDLPGGPVHTRPVSWRVQLPRRAFDPDILMSFGAFMTVCRIERNGAEPRVRALMDQATDPAQASARAPSAPRFPQPRPPASLPDLETRLHGLIHDRIAQRFKGHLLAGLVASLLEAQGYRARVSAAGPDGGVDILAGSGPLGFDAPRLVVQVKSQDSKVDVRTLRELAGVMNRFQADHGLLVGWGGFNAPVRAEAAADYFRVRLWDAADVVAAVKELYDRLPAAVRAEIPLKQVWTLVPEDQPGVAA